MKVHFLGEIREYRNTSKDVYKAVEKINEQISRTQKVFSHLRVDGLDLYENHYQYLLDEVESIHDVHIVLLEREEMAAELQLSLNDYLTRAIPVMEQLADSFYQGAKAEDWDSFSNLADGFQWILGALQTLTQYADEEAASYYVDIREKITSILEELMNATEAQDTVTIADMIQYEVVETLVELKQNVHH